MNIFNADLSDLIVEFFQVNKVNLSDYLKANDLIKKESGINSFFASQMEANEVLEKIAQTKSSIIEPDRREYGDFQTNSSLASQVAKYAFSKEYDFEFVLEPTCGTGNFLLASISQSKSLKKVVGVEIYKPYVWETKFKIFNYFLENKGTPKPEIDIIHANAFEFSYEQLAESTKHLKTLVIGNPPWVTNAELGSIASTNVPQKTNFKKHSGFDAITGKGNFDIGEYISLIMLDCFQNHNGLFAFLIKNSVVKNLIEDLKRTNYKVSGSEKLNIDSKKEFDVSVNASLFLAHFNTVPNFTCREFDFYSREHITTFGWYKGKFVYSVEDYDQSSIIDGQSVFTWRSGVKHDCSKVMELEQTNGHYMNGLGEHIDLEKDLVYGLIKSSDLKGNETNKFRKLTIITQKRIGEETGFIKDEFPLTFQYLNSHKEYFEKRKSSIYIGKPDFSIFGIGDYSFVKYKIAISGLYKSTHFTLVKPSNSKTIMLDDTCYFIGFDELISAQIAHYLVNSDLVQKFLKSIIFSDSKRSINKDILMRIDFGKAWECTNFNVVKRYIPDMSMEHWTEFGETIKRGTRESALIFPND